MAQGLPPVRVAARIVLLLALIALGGCASRVSTRGFVLQAESDVNDHSPIAVEIVLVRDPALLERVSSLSARAWFAESAQLERDHPGGFLRERWEMVPGQRLDLDLPFPDRRGVAVFVFANYLSPGAHRIRVDDRNRFTLVLGRTEFSLEGRPRPSSSSSSPSP
jgi:type VI secretion system protein